MDMSQSFFLVLGNSATGALHHIHKRANAYWFQTCNKKPRLEPGLLSVLLRQAAQYLRYSPISLP